MRYRLLALLLRLSRDEDANPHVPPFLLGERAMPAAADAYQPGSVEEAVLAAYALTEWTRDTRRGTLAERNEIDAADAPPAEPLRAPPVDAISAADLPL